MQVTYIGAFIRTGVSAKTGNSYQISKCLYAVPMISKTTDAYNYEAYGSEVRELDLAPHALADFNGLVSGDQVDLKLEPLPNNPTRNQVIKASAV